MVEAGGHQSYECDMRVFFSELEDEILVLVAQYRWVDDDYIGIGSQDFLREILGAI